MKKRHILFAITVLLALGLFAVYRWATQPVVTTKTIIGSTPPPTFKAPSAQPVASIDNAYFTSVLPSDMKVQYKNDKPNGSTLLQMSILSISAGKGDQLSITLGRLSGSISELSDVKVRTMAPQTYKPAEFSGLPSGAISFTKQEGTYERDIFWPHGGKYAAIAISGHVDRKVQMDEVLKNIISKWQWR